MFRHEKLSTYSCPKSQRAYATVTEAGLKDGTKIQMLGSTETELGGMKKVEDEMRRREEILRQRAGKNLPKVRDYT